MIFNRNACCTATFALLFIAGVLMASTPSPIYAQTEKPAATDNRVGTVDASQLPEAKQTSLGLLISTPVMLRALIRPKISAALREKLFLAVSAINECRLCKWGHTHWAIAKGVPLEEVNQILGLQTESLAANNPSEASAILFAQHYAEQLGKVDPESIENVSKYYSKVEVAEILAYVRFIMLTNLTGNTLDSLWTGVRSLSKRSGGNKRAVSSAASPNSNTQG